MVTPQSVAMSSQLLTGIGYVLSRGERWAILTDRAGEVKKENETKGLARPAMNAERVSR